MSSAELWTFVEEPLGTENWVNKSVCIYRLESIRLFVFCLEDRFINVFRQEDTCTHAEDGKDGSQARGMSPDGGGKPLPQPYQ